MSRQGRHRQYEHDVPDVERVNDGIPAPRADLAGHCGPPVDAPYDRADPVDDPANDPTDEIWDGWDGVEDEWHDAEDAEDAEDSGDGEPAFGDGAWDDQSREDRAVNDARDDQTERLLPEPAAEPPSRTSGSHRVVAPADETRGRRRAARRGGRVLRRVVWVAAGIAALVGVALAAVVAFPQLTERPAAPVPVAAPAAAPTESAFGERVERSDGWTVVIDEPATARDADDLPSGAARGVVVDVVLTNTGAEPRDTAGWTVKALVGSTPVDVSPEAVPSRTVRPGASLSFPVTVPMPKASSDLQLEAAPPGGVPSLFVGTA